MEIPEQPANRSDVKKESAAHHEKMDRLLGRIDLVAVLTLFVGVLLLGVVSVVVVIIELAKMISRLWSDSFDRWLIIVLALTIVWIAARWKRMSLF